MLRKLDKFKPHQKYYLKDGRQAIGASSIAKVGDDPGGLIHWAWKLGMQGKDYRTYRDAAADAGEVCHGLIEAYLKGDTLDLSDFNTESITEAETGYLAFRDWWEHEGMIFIASELQLVSDEHGYGGTLDILARDPEGRKCLLDIKHTNSIRESHLRQLAGYENLCNEDTPDDPVERRAILNTKGGMTEKWIGPTDKYFHTFKCQIALINAFKAEGPSLNPRRKKK